MSLGPIARDLGLISKAEFLLSSGSIAVNLNLYGCSYASKPVFLTMLVSNTSLSTFSRSLLSYIFQSTCIALIPVFLSLNVLVIDYEFTTSAGIGNVGGVVL